MITPEKIKVAYRLLVRRLKRRWTRRAILQSRDPSRKTFILAWVATVLALMVIVMIATRMDKAMLR